MRPPKDSLFNRPGVAGDVLLTLSNQLLMIFLNKSEKLNNVFVPQTAVCVPK